MDIDEDDDFYGADESEAAPAQPAPAAASTTAPAATPAAPSKPDAADELEEGEEEDEGGAMDEDDDSDIDIIVESKDSSKAPPQSQSRYSEIRNIPQRTAANEPAVKMAPPKKEEPKQAGQPAVSTSKLDINAIPIHQPSGKPLTQLDFEQDLADNDKPWRKPGTDVSDYFNYGFDEFTWSMYAAKQESLRVDYAPEAVFQMNKKATDDFQSQMAMMMGGMMPHAMGGAAGPSGDGAAAVPGMPGMEMAPEMQQFMQQMMTNGMDPSQMDPNTMAAMYAQMQGAAAGQGGQAGQGQNFAGGYGGNQGQGYGYEHNMGGGQAGGGGGGGGGRGGRGRGRRW